MLEGSVEFDNLEGITTLVAETFKVQLIFDFHTKLCFKFLDLFIESTDEFFESTQIGYIIDFVYEKHKYKLFMQ